MQTKNTFKFPASSTPAMQEMAAGIFSTMDRGQSHQHVRDGQQETQTVKCKMKPNHLRCS